MLTAMMLAPARPSGGVRSIAMDDEKWVSRDDALYELRVRCNLSPGAAQNKLRAICVEGDVRIFDPLAPLFYYDGGVKRVCRGAEVQGTTLNLPIPERLHINFFRIYCGGSIETRRQKCAPYQSSNPCHHLRGVTQPKKPAGR
jgi:hypothetical protein